MASEPTQTSLEDRLKSLLQDEALVLYWKCRRYDHEQIAQKVQWGTAWVQLRMVRIYKKLGVRKEMHWTKRARVLRREVCPIFNELIKNDLRNIPKIFAPEVEFIEDIEVIEEENQVRSVVKVHQEEETPAGVLTEEEKVILDLVLYDEMKEEEEKEEEEEDERIREEPINIPPQPLLKSGLTGGTRPIWIALGLFLICACIAGVAWMQKGRIFGMLAPTAILSPSQNVSGFDPTEGPTATQGPASTPRPTNTPEPTLTYTPEVLPTAAPFPGMETFSNPLSDLWEVSGDPYIATGTNISGQPFDKSLTAKKGDVVTITTGNKGWTDYVINLQANSSITGMEMTLGVRVQDQNNMITLKCMYDNCSWIVLSDGRENILLENNLVLMQQGPTIRVEGNDFIATYYDGFQTREVSISLPEKYQEKFKNGGVLIRYKNTEFNYIEIQPE
jgi:hypothetical protein